MQGWGWHGRGCQPRDHCSSASAFISVNLLDIFNKTLAHFPAVFMAKNPNTGALSGRDDHPPMVHQRS